MFSKFVLKFVLNILYRHQIDVTKKELAVQIRLNVTAVQERTFLSDVTTFVNLERMFFFTKSIKFGQYKIQD